MIKNNYYKISIFIISMIYIFFYSVQYDFMIYYAGHDDGLAVKLARSILNGEWLGVYNDLTLSKGIVYSLWLCLLNIFSIPVSLGRLILYLFSCLFMQYILSTLFHKPLQKLCIYTFMLFNPVNVTNALTRVYRDSITPSLIMLVIGWSMGIFLWVINLQDNKKDKLSLKIINTVGIFSVPSFYFIREDSIWIIPILIMFSIVSVIFYSNIKKNAKNSAKYNVRTFIFIISMPLISAILYYATIATINKNIYGRFVLSDYVSSDFKSAYGALTRIKSETWDFQVPVSEDAREKAYRISPAFKELKKHLDNNRMGASENFKHQFNKDLKKSNYDYTGGTFLWALRIAVKSEGYYKNPKMVEEYYKKIADEINEACDNGTLESYTSKRSTLAPIFNKLYIKPTIYAFFDGMKFLTTMKSFNVSPSNVLLINNKNTVNELYNNNQFRNFVNGKELFQEMLNANPTINGWGFYKTSENKYLHIWPEDIYGNKIDFEISHNKSNDIFESFKKNNNIINEDAKHARFSMTVNVQNEGEIYNLCVQGSDGKIHKYSILEVENNNINNNEEFYLYIESIVNKIEYQSDKLTKMELWKFDMINSILKVYKSLLPFMCIFSTLIYIIIIILVIYRYVKFRKIYILKEFIILTGIFLSILLRIAMLSYITVTSFNALTDLYMSSLYPMLLLFILISIYSSRYIYENLKIISYKS